MLLGPVLVVSGDVSLQGLLSWLPLGWADLTVLIDVLEGLNESENLLNVSSDWKVVVGSVSQDTLSVNDESGSKKLRNNFE